MTKRPVSVVLKQRRAGDLWSGSWFAFMTNDAYDLTTLAGYRDDSGVHGGARPYSSFPLSIAQCAAQAVLAMQARGIHHYTVTVMPDEKAVADTEKKARARAQAIRQIENIEQQVGQLREATNDLLEKLSSLRDDLDS